MEGLIPLVYKAIMQYRNGDINSWLNESPSASYVRLPGDSGRFAFTTATTTSSSPPSSSATNRRLVNAGIQSPAGCHLDTRRAVK